MLLTEEESASESTATLFNDKMVDEKNLPASVILDFSDKIQNHWQHSKQNPATRVSKVQKIQKKRSEKF